MSNVVITPKTVACLCAMWLLTMSQALGQPRIKIGPNVHVSTARQDEAHFEAYLAADLTNGSRLCAGAMVTAADKSDYKIVYYTSFDGGVTWELALEFNRDATTADPVCGYGLDGTGYLVSLGREIRADGRYERKMFVHRSSNEGKAWSSPVELPFIDRQWITIDRTGGKYHARMYIHGTAGIGTVDGEGPIAGLTVFRSTDGGATFEQAVKLGSTGNRGPAGMGNGVVLSDGTLVILFGERLDRTSTEARPSKPNSKLKVVTSEDGGETFSKAVDVADYYYPARKINTSRIPVLAVDQSEGPLRDRLYVVWPDVRSGRWEVLLAYSSDKGKTWSRPLVVSDDRPRSRRDPEQGPDNHLPSVAVNKAGVVGVLWLDRRDHPDNLGWWPRFAASLDGGDTFLPSVKVSEAPYSLDQLENPVALHARSSGGGSRSATTARPGELLRAELTLNEFYFFGGDTSGLATANGEFHLLWVDNRTGSPQLWTTSVTVQGSAVRNGSADLAELQDVSGNVSFDFKNAWYSADTRTISVEASLGNTSKETLVGPLKVRVLTLKSEYGIPEILNAENRQGGTGAVWDFTSLLEGAVLKPGERSRGKRLEFRLSDLEPLKPTSNVVLGLAFVSLETRVLGKIRAASNNGK